MRLTLINQFYAPDLSPTAHLCASLAEHRAARGDDVTVLTSRAGYVRSASRGSGAPTNNGVRVRRLWSTRFGSGSNLRRLFDWATFYVRATLAVVFLPRQDVIVALTTPPFIALAGVLHKRLHPKAKLVLWNMDTYPEAIERTGLTKPNGWVPRIMRAANRAIFRQLDHLVCLDGAMRDLLLSQYSPPGRTIPHTIIPNWERAALFANASIADTWDDPLMQQLAGRFIVLYLGNAGYGHEFKTALDAAEELSGDPVTFLFVGGGALRPWIEREVLRRGLANVVLHDYVRKEQTPAVMRTAGCALITLDDAMAGVMSPSKLHANLAMGLPVLYVGPAGSNVDEAIAHFGCGASLRPGDAGGIVQFVRAMVKDPTRLASLQQRARDAFVQAYCDAQALPRFDTVFEGLLKLRLERV